MVLTDADVKFSDDTTESSTLEWLQMNLDLNHDVIGERAAIQPLLWGDKSHMNAIEQGFDLIVGSELLYNNGGSFPSLVDTIRNFATNDSTPVLLGYKVRGLGEAEFFERAEEYFDITFIRIGRKSDKINLAELRLRTPI